MKGCESKIKWTQEFCLIYATCHTTAKFSNLYEYFFVPSELNENYFL